MNNTSTYIAKHVRAVYFGGNWADSNLKEHLTDLTWQEAITSVYGLNTILTLAYHVNYYVHEIAKVVEGAPLTSRDKFSFQHPSINSQEDWDALLAQFWEDGENFVKAIEKMPEAQVWADFTDEKYGNYYSNLNGIIEHIHYHLGQIVVIKKILSNSTFQVDS